MTIENLIEELNLFLEQEEPFEPAVLDILNRIYHWIYWSTSPARVPIIKLSKRAKLKYPRLTEDIERVESLRIAPTYIPSAAAAELGRRGGQSTTPAKTQASRSNGKKGGRPVRINSDAFD